MSVRQKLSKKMRLPNFYIIGSGFSKAAGLPLGTEIFEEVIKEAKKTEIYTRILLNDIERYLDYHNNTKTGQISEADIILEDFLSFLDIEHYLKLQGRDHWSMDGNQTQLAMKNIIAKILHREKEEILNFELYEKFGRSLCPGDIVITFNYDTILETVLNHIGKKIVFCEDDFSQYKYDKNVEEDERPILILKLHGSIDWYSVKSHIKSQEYALHSTIFYEQKHPVFSFSDKYFPERVFRHLDNPESDLKYVYRISKIKEVQSGSPSVTESPLIISPSYTKMVYLNEIVDLWYGLNSWGNHCASMTIIGFSLPEHDEYVRQVLFHIIDNYLDQEDLKAIYIKPPLRIVDKINNGKDINRLKSRYSFVDWSQVMLFKNGFSDEAILTDDFIKKTEIS